MGFRDDHEANVQRIELLERDLASTKNQLEAALLRAAEVDDLRKRTTPLTSERDALRGGNELAWAAKYRRVVSICIALGIALVAVCGVGLTHAQRVAAERARIVELDESRLARSEASCEATQTELRVARAELDAIDAANADELHSLERQLSEARMHEAGPILIVTGRVISRAGDVPSGAGDRCALAIRESRGGTCVATVTCGSAVLFPLTVDEPDVVCGAEGGAWRAAGTVPLDHARAIVPHSSVPLLDYDARTGMLTVAETGSPQFTLHVRTDASANVVLR